MIDKPDNPPLDTTYSDERPVVKKSGWFTVFIAILSLFFTLVGIAAGYKHWQRMNDRVRDTQAELKTLRSAIKNSPNQAVLDALRTDLTAKVQQTETNAQQQLQSMERIQTQTRQFADTVTAQVEQITYLQARMQQNAVPNSSNEWHIAQIRYLLQVANQELQLARNQSVALAALKTAETELSQLGGVNYLPVRQQLTKDIQTLNAFTQPNTTEISQRITALMTKLPTFKRSGTDAPKTDQATAKPAAEGLTIQAMQLLNDAVIVRRIDQPVSTLFNSDTRAQLQALLYLRLENLRLLALQRDNTGFHEQLKLMGDMVKQYAQPEQSNHSQELDVFQSELDALGKINLQPALPDISGSLKQLDSAQQAEVSQRTEIDKAAEAEEKNTKSETKSDAKKPETASTSTDKKSQEGKKP